MRLDMRGNLGYWGPRHTETGTRIKSMFHPVNLPVQGMENRQPCHDHAQKGVGLFLFLTISSFLVPLPRTFWNIPWWSTHFRHDAYSRPYQYDVEWRSTFHGFLGPSVWLDALWTIYYKLYGIKYKYRVVAILYRQSCICLSLDNPRPLLIFYPVWALRSPLNHCPLYHWTIVFTASQSYSRWVVQSRQALDKPGRDSQDRHNTTRILCLRVGTSLISLGRLNPLHRPINFCFIFWANDLAPLCICSRTVCLVVITGCLDLELDSEVSGPRSMSYIMKGNIETKGGVWVRVRDTILFHWRWKGFHRIDWPSRCACTHLEPEGQSDQEKEDDSSGGGKAAKVMTRTSTKNFIPKVSAVRWEVTTCTLWLLVTQIRWASKWTRHH